MRKYRIRIYDSGREVLTDRDYAAFLDLDTGSGRARSRRELNQTARSLAIADGATGDDIAAYYLRIEDWDTDKHVMDWPATTADE